MTDPRLHEPLDEALSRLPRHKSSPDFTDRTLAALDRRANRRIPRPIAIAAASLALLAMLLGFGVQRQRAEEQKYLERVEQLQFRYRDLLREVGTVRRQAAPPASRIYLGGDEQLDLVLDLGQVELTAASDPTPSDLRPTSLEN